MQTHSSSFSPQGSSACPSCGSPFSYPSAQRGIPVDPISTLVQPKRKDSAKLTAEEVRDIRRRLQAGASRREVAAVFVVSPSTIRKIALGETWREAGAPPHGAAISTRLKRSAKLTAEQVHEIRVKLLLKNPPLRGSAFDMSADTLQRVADEFGVSSSTIRKIAEWTIWKEVV